MNLKKKEFDILNEIIKGATSQRDIESRTGYSLGTINKTVNELNEMGLIEDKKCTKLGYEVMEQYKVKRAIFIAAGFGSRLVPITLNTPKPLVRVNGKRIIDGLIDACLEAGIEEIIIVRGYLREQFDQLLYKYPMIKFIDNLMYNEANNISSGYMVRDMLENAYVFEADLLISNPKIIEKYHYQSDFLAIKKDRTDDWCFTEEKGFITGQLVGGINCWQMVGISYWDKEDGAKLKNHIEEAFNMPGGKERYWEQVALVVFKDQYKVMIKECKAEDIVEIDTFNELKAIDKSYAV